MQQTGENGSDGKTTWTLIILSIVTSILTVWLKNTYSTVHWVLPRLVRKECGESAAILSKLGDVLWQLDIAIKLLAALAVVMVCFARGKGRAIVVSRFVAILFVLGAVFIGLVVQM